MTYRYRTGIRWTGERRGVLSSKGRPDLEVACGPEFGGHEGYWTPEHIFVAAIEHCTMSTFLWLAERRRARLVFYESEAEAVATMTGGGLAFTTVTVRVRIGIASETDRRKVERCLDDVPRYCMVHRSVRTGVTVEPEIFVS